MFPFCREVDCERDRAGLEEVPFFCKGVEFCLPAAGLVDCSGRRAVELLAVGDFLGARDGLTLFVTARDRGVGVDDGPAFGDVLDCMGEAAVGDALSNRLCFLLTDEAAEAELLPECPLDEGCMGVDCARFLRLSFLAGRFMIVGRSLFCIVTS